MSRRRGERYISSDDARRLYDWLGARYDAAERYESGAKARARQLLGLASGQRVLHVGVGAGHDQARLQEAVAPSGVVAGVDISPVMLGLTRARTGAALARADARALPCGAGQFDRLFSAYLLDLLPAGELRAQLSEFRRVLRPGGRLALVSLTEGTSPVSRLMIGAWKLAYRANPLLCGGCRPLRLAALAQAAGFVVVAREVVTQLGLPSEVLAAVR
jgi:demethylmenaquinone methyltransferase/2-methoxy-6-polyprenyl-1,4-benzoquinol methylase